MKSVGLLFFYINAEMLKCHNSTIFNLKKAPRHIFISVFSLIMMKELSSLDTLRSC